jgi:hypothetical protein
MASGALGPSGEQERATVGQIAQFREWMWVMATTHTRKHTGDNAPGQNRNIFCG